jgi:hypothetical protein
LVPGRPAFWIGTALKYFFSLGRLGVLAPNQVDREKLITPESLPQREFFFIFSYAFIRNGFTPGFSYQRFSIISIFHSTIQVLLDQA